MWVNITGGEPYIRFDEDGTKTREEEATTDRVYADFLDILNNHNEYIVMLEASCGTFELEYQESSDEKEFEYTSDDINFLIKYTTASNVITIGGENDGCYPAQIVVTKK